MAKGDILLITFPFTNLSGSKLRPSVILAENKDDVTVSFITTELGWAEDSDILLQPSNINGLKKTSLIRTSKIATLDKDLVKGILGKLNNEELNLLNEKLIAVLGL